MNIGRFGPVGKTALIAAATVVAAYTLIFTAILASGGSLDGTHAAVQVSFQVIGISLVAALLAWIIQKCW